MKDDKLEIVKLPGEEGDWVLIGRDKSGEPVYTKWAPEYGSYEDDEVAGVKVEAEAVHILPGGTMGYFVGHAEDGVPIYQGPGFDDDVIFKDRTGSVIHRIPFAVWPFKSNDYPDYLQMWVNRDLKFFRNESGGVAWVECDRLKVACLDGDLMPSDPFWKDPFKKDA